MVCNKIVKRREWTDEFSTGHHVYRPCCQGRKGNNGVGGKNGRNGQSGDPGKEGENGEDGVDACVGIFDLHVEVG